MLTQAIIVALLATCKGPHSDVSATNVEDQAKLLTYDRARIAATAFIATHGNNPDATSTRWVYTFQDVVELGGVIRVRFRFENEKYFVTNLFAVVAFDPGTGKCRFLYQL